MRIFFVFFFSLVLFVADNLSLFHFFPNFGRHKLLNVEYLPISKNKINELKQTCVASRRPKIIHENFACFLLFFSSFKWERQSIEIEKFVSSLEPAARPSEIHTNMANGNPFVFPFQDILNIPCLALKKDYFISDSPFSLSPCAYLFNEGRNVIDKSRSTEYKLEQVRVYTKFYFIKIIIFH